MKNLIATSLFCMILFSTYGQSTFEKTYGGVYDEYAHSVLQTDDNGFILCGYTCSYGEGQEDVYVVKTDVFGNVEWKKTYGGPGEDHGYYISKTNDGGYIICAESTSFGSRTMGDTLWTKNINENYLSTSRCAVQTEDNGFVVCGSTSMTNLGETDILLFKLNESGELIWSKKYGGEGYDFSYSICKTIDGGVILCGGSSYDKSEYDIYIIKTNAQGDTTWTRKWGGSGYNAGYCILPYEDGNFLVGGCSSSTGTMYHILLKINNEGETIWSKTIGEDESNFGMHIAFTNDNCIVGCGWSKNFNEQESRLNLYKTDADGNLIWLKNYGGYTYDLGYDVFESNDLGLVVAGYTQSFGAGMADMYLIKTDAEGIITSMDELQQENSSFNIFPNPASSFITITTSQNQPIEEVIIYNHLGQKALVTKPVNNKVDVSKLKPGIYFIEVASKEWRGRTKIVKK
jgi:hypothetical protein